MSEYLKIIYEGVTEISADEVMGAMVVGLALALACYGLCALGRKRANDPLPLLCGLIFAISALSMAIGVGHSRYRSLKGVSPNGWTATQSGPGGFPGPGGPGGGPPMHRPLGRALLHRADADRNGQLTPDEAARFVREADLAGKGWVDASDIDQAHRGPVGPRPLSDFHPDTARPGGDRVEKTPQSPLTGPVGPDQDSTGASGSLGSSEGTRAAGSRSG